MKVATVQFCHLPGDRKGNLNLMEPFVIDAHKKGVELIIFPEMCISGYWHVRNLNVEGVDALSEPRDGQSYQRLKQWSEKFQISIGAGIIEKSKDGKFYNTYLVVMPNGEMVYHRKIHCFINSYMDSGSEYTVFELPNGWKAGILICYDNNIIENVRSTALLGADVILAPHQTGGCSSRDPNLMGSINIDLWENRIQNPQAIEKEFKGDKGRGWLMRWLPSRAHDNGVFYIFSNGVGRDDNEVRTGNAMVIDTYGRILSETWKADQDMVIADLDPKLLERNSGRRWMKTRRPELYKIISTKTGNEQDTREVRFDEVGA